MVWFLIVQSISFITLFLESVCLPPSHSLCTAFTKPQSALPVDVPGVRSAAPSAITGWLRLAPVGVGTDMYLSRIRLLLSHPWCIFPPRSTWLAGAAGPALLWGHATRLGCRNVYTACWLPARINSMSFLALPRNVVFFRDEIKHFSELGCFPYSLQCFSASP